MISTVLLLYILLSYILLLVDLAYRCKKVKLQIVLPFYTTKRLYVSRFASRYFRMSTFRFSAALGQGMRLGFLGILHMEVFRERLEQVRSIDFHPELKFSILWPVVK